MKGGTAAMDDIAILVVDDAPDHRDLVVAALAQRCDPARIATAEGGADALDFLLARGRHAARDPQRQPRLVLLDLKMAGMDGLGVIEAMRTEPRTAHVPVVVLTGSVDKRELDRAYALGANSVVRKPVGFEELRAKLAKVYDFWITVNEGNRHSRV